jgi:hypothetical protein
MPKPTRKRPTKRAATPTPAPTHGPSDEQERNVVRLLEKGYPETHAIPLSGMKRATYYWWLDVGRAAFDRDEDTRHARFYSAVENAKARAQGNAIEHLHGFMHGTVERTVVCEVCQAAQTVELDVPKSEKAVRFFLERRFKEWARRDHLEIEQRIGADELRQLLEDMAVAAQNAVNASGLLTPVAAESLLEAIGQSWYGLVSARYPELAPRQSADAAGDRGRPLRRLAGGQ